MINTIQPFEIVSQSVISTLINHYNAAESYETEIMNKLPSTDIEHLATPIISEILKTKIKYINGNFYKHSIPYLPHTDYHPRDNNTINVVIPLQYSNSLPSLVIFDQAWDQAPVTWCMQHRVQTYAVNIGVKGCPYEYPSVKNLTGKRIDDSLYQHLTHYPRNFLFGLSGTACPFKIGSIILFDNRKIHCTSTFTGTKLGLSLRYQVD